MKYVYLFSEGNKNMKNILGGKGANLAEMVNMKIPVPMGFTITTSACNKYYDDKKTLNKTIVTQVKTKIKELEKITGKKFGVGDNPLLVSVRSGARASMPGMMDTILNLGLNDEVAENYSNKTGNVRFVYDSYRRFISMYADVVKSYPKEEFEDLLTSIKKSKNIENDIDLTAEDMVEVTIKFKKLYKRFENEDFPQNPEEQLINSVKAVFNSWMNERAIIYRKMHDIPVSWGTAVNVQEMVYGNTNENSGTGVAFSRNPSTGEDVFYGEYLINAQGEDVVAGVRTPQSIDTLKEEMPKIYDQFYKIAKKLEKHYKDMQDMEFTIENGKLYMLQTRIGKRTANAAIKIAVDMVHEKLITKKEAVSRVDAKSLSDLLHPTFDEKDLKANKVIAKGLAASPGAASGKIYFTAKDAVKAARDGDVILVRTETSPEDIEGMNSAKAVVTVRGGMTSHAAVVARGMGTVCVCGVSDLVISEKSKTLSVDGLSFKEGDFISVDGSTGLIYEGIIKTKEVTLSDNFVEFMDYARNFKRLGVKANAETVKDANVAKKFGCEGIGLSRTEHMFFDKERIFEFRKMILADNIKQREDALKQILPYQRRDFEKLFEIMDNLPVVIRYLDPPLHEFLPKTNDEIELLATSLGITTKQIKQTIEELKEFNPMMGHRGCRLAITYPEIARMQTRAVIEAAINVSKKGIKVNPQIMIPLIGDLKEFTFIKKIVEDEADSIFAKKSTMVNYKIGTMIEIPRAALIADEIATESQFFSFGTNDLTQMTYGFSRDDAGKFLPSYYDNKIFEKDPFETVDQTGVGSLVKMAVDKGKMINKKIELGICGEHGADPASIEFFNEAGLDYVSCSPYRIPTAILAAAQAAIKCGTPSGK